jgi:hypothetical protein
MDNADKGALRLGLGMALSVAIAWGVGLEAAFMAPVMTVTLLAKPGPPIPLVKGAVLGFIVAALLLAGVLTVPLLKNYPVSGVLVTSALFYTVTYTSARKANPLTLFMHVALVFIPTAGVANQAATTLLARTTGVALVIGVVASAVAHAVFPDAPEPAKAAPAAPAGASPEAAGWLALQATLIVMPMFMLALSNPAFYLQGVMKTVGLGQQAGATTARTAGRELVGSTLVGAVLAMLIWGGLSLRPNLWMFALWTAAASLWIGVRMFGVKATPYGRSYWLNAMMSLFFVLGPAITDSANGDDAYRAGVVRVTLFLLVALYASTVVKVLERWRASRSLLPVPGLGTST